MTTSKHTPGPWATGLDSVAPKVFHAASGSVVAYVDSQCEREQASNARLISAAPDLAEALRGLLLASEAHDGTAAGHAAVIAAEHAAHAALAKAGVQP